MGISNQTRLADKWGFGADMQYRRKDHLIEHASLSILRIGGTYYINNDCRLTAGYAYLNSYPGEGHKNVNQPEHRPWQQLQWMTSYKHFRLTQAIRLEERFRHKILNDNELAHGYNFNYRARFNLQLSIPLTKKGFAPGGLQASVGNEIHLNFGKKIIYNSFDQNRFSAGILYPITTFSQFNIHYINIFQQQSAGNQYKQIHAIRLLYNYNLDWRKK